MSESPKERFKLFHYGVNVLADDVHGPGAIASATKRVIDAYRDGDVCLEIALDVAGKGIESPSDYYVAILERAALKDFIVRDRNIVDGKTMMLMTGCDRHRVKDPMSVLTRKLMEEPQAFAPSIVRLYRLQPTPVLIGKFLYPAFLAEESRIIEEGELYRFGLEVEGWVLSESEQCKLIGHVVQSSAVGIEKQAETIRESLKGKGLFGWIDQASERGCPPLTVVLNVNRVRIRLNKADDLGVKGLSVAVCPPQTAPCVSQFDRPLVKPGKELGIVRHD